MMKFLFKRNERLCDENHSWFMVTKERYSAACAEVKYLINNNQSSLGLKPKVLIVGPNKKPTKFELQKQKYENSKRKNKKK